MARRTKKVASRGSVNNIILQSLISGEKYGYEIIKEVEEKTDGKVKLKQPSLYSSLKRFEDKGLISSYWGDSDIGGRRHYYTITDKGKELFEVNQKHKNRFSDDSLEETDSASEVIEETQNNVVEQISEDDSEHNVTYDVDKHQTEEDDSIFISHNFNNFSVDDKINALLDNAKPQMAEDKGLVPPVEEEKVVSNEEPTNATEINSDEINELYNAMEEDNNQDNEILVNENDNELSEPMYDHQFYKPTPITDMTNSVHPERTSPVSLEKEPSNVSISDSPKDEDIINQKHYEIFTDEFGITKLKSDDKIDSHQAKQEIIDNVHERIQSTDILTKQPTAPEHHEDIQEQKSSEYVDNSYKNILGGLFNDKETKQEKQVQENMYSSIDNSVKPTTPPTIETFSSNAQKQGFNVKIYNKETEKTYKNEYLLVNKLKMVFGLTIMILMILQTTIILAILKSKGLLYDEQNWVYICAYAISLLLGAVYSVPILLNPQKQQTKYMKFSYTILFGALAFFVSLILIYALNTFMGMDSSNAINYLSTILVPSILALNFVLGPIIYKVLSLNKFFY